MEMIPIVSSSSGSVCWPSNSYSSAAKTITTMVIAEEENPHIMDEPPLNRNNDGIVSAVEKNAEKLSKNVMLKNSG